MASAESITPLHVLGRTLLNGGSVRSEEGPRRVRPHREGCEDAFTVTAKDDFGNTTPTYTGTVTFTSSDPQAVFNPTSYTFVAGDNGVHTFTNGATLKTAGTQTITATDSTGFGGSSPGIIVNPAAMVGFAVFGYPSGGSTFEFHTFIVEAVDAFGNQITNYRGTVRLSSDDALLPGDYTFTDADAGMHVFTTAFQTAGTHYLQAVDVAIGNLFGREDDIVVV